MCDIVNGPGEFEGQPCYAQKLYETILDGGTYESLDDPEDGQIYDIVLIDDLIDDDFKRAHRLHNAAGYAAVTAFLCWDTDLGFFNVQPLTQVEMHDFISEINAEWDAINAEDE